MLPYHFFGLPVLLHPGNRCQPLEFPLCPPLSVDPDPHPRNPAVEEQAIDRIHRLGQLNEVSVKRFVVSGTVEDKMLALQVSLPCVRCTLNRYFSCLWI